MSIFKILFGSNKKEKERLQKEKEVYERLQKEKEEKERLQKEKEEQEEKERIQREKNILLLKELDSDGDGLIDIVDEDDYGKILRLNQDKIIEINRDYIKQFVQISNYLKTKRKSLQSIYEKLLKCVNEGGVEMYTEFILKKSLTPSKLDFVKEVKKRTGWSLRYSKDVVDKYLRTGTVEPKTYRQPLNEQIIAEYVEILKDDSHIFNLLLVQSITMVQSLIKNDMITFYEIHQKLDELNMFDSKHEKDVKKLLGEMNNNLDVIIKEIREVGQSVVSSIGDLSLITEETARFVKEGLDSVNSSIQSNNLLTGIQTYQLYKINKNTKSL